MCLPCDCVKLNMLEEIKVSPGVATDNNNNSHWSLLVGLLPKGLWTKHCNFEYVSLFEINIIV